MDVQAITAPPLGHPPGLTQSAVTSSSPPKTVKENDENPSFFQCQSF